MESHGGRCELLEGTQARLDIIEFNEMDESFSSHPFPYEEELTSRPTVESTLLTNESDDKRG